MNPLMYTPKMYNRGMLKKLIAVFSFALLFSAKSLAASEQIDNFATGVTISKDGMIKVVETIDYNFGSNERHGIFRNIKKRNKNQDGQLYETPISVLSVTDLKGTAYSYTTEDSGDYLKLKIGDANKLVTGLQNYIITYTVKGAIGDFSDHDELYWNVTGNEWEVPILASSVTVVFEGQTQQPSNPKADCFTGPSGATQKNCRTAAIDFGQVFTMDKALGPMEGFTIVYGFDKGYVSLIPPEKVANYSWLFAILAFLWYFCTPGLVLLYYLKFGRDPKTNTAIPALFEPPKDGIRRLAPGESGTIIDESADDADLTATIVDLAIRGHLKISEEAPDGINKLAGSLIPSLTKKTFRFTKSVDYKTKDKEALQNHEQIVLDGLFEYGNEVTTDELKDTFHSDADKFKESLYLQTIQNGFFPSNPQTIRTIWMGIGVAAIFITGNIPLGIMCLLLAKAMPRKTMKGARTQVDILGLKKFLSSQERQLNFQEENWYLFEKLLPYAIAFGVTEVWAKRFEHLGNMPQTSWYSGTSTLNSYMLASSLNSFGSTMHSASTPVRSSSGFSSGFSGGSSGGGGGGGGGGSW